MGFVVNHRTGMTKNSDFEAFARLLRQRGVDLGNVPRVPDRDSPDHRWAYVWSAKAEAEAFAEELNRLTHTQDWVSYEVNSPPSEGPLGPLVLRVARQSDGLVFELHPLSRALLGSAYPQAVGILTTPFIGRAAWDSFRRSGQGLWDLIAQLLPNMTGLDAGQIGSLGFKVLDAETDETLVHQAPAALIH